MKNLTSSSIPASLSARSVALELLTQVLRRKRPLDEALDDTSGVSQVTPRDRAFARLLVATVLRRVGQIDALIQHCVANPLPARAAPVHDMLRLGICQLLFLRTPAHAAVATTVDLAEAMGFASHKGLVNAVLRRLATQGPALAAQQDAARLNTPDWLWDSWTAAYGAERCRAIAEAHLREAPLDITVRNDRLGWAERLDAILLPTKTLRRAAGGAVTALPGFDEGAWWVQDAAAAIPAQLFGNVDDKTVYDLCAAPGGKAAQLAAGGAHVVAIDRSSRRLERLTANLQRLGLVAETITADCSTWVPPQPAWGVLLDAPCTATGAIRRHPDILHLKSRDDVLRLASVQYRLLESALAMVEVGGLLVFCTCSLEPEEGPAHIEKLLAQDRRFVREPISAEELGGAGQLLTAEGDLRTMPNMFEEIDGIDGFYAARLRRIA